MNISQFQNLFVINTKLQNNYYFQSIRLQIQEDFQSIFFEYLNLLHLKFVLR